MNSKEKGIQLEKFVSGLFKDIDKKARPTKASGACNEVGDVLNSLFYIEAKFRNTKNITLQTKVWQKLCADVPFHSLKMPLYILQNKNKETWAVLDIKDLIKLAECYITP